MTCLPGDESDINLLGNFDGVECDRSTAEVRQYGNFSLKFYSNRHRKFSGNKILPNFLSEISNKNPSQISDKVLTVKSFPTPLENRR